MTERPRHFAWMEIGRAAPADGAPWTAWLALLPEGGALYRTLVVADDTVTVMVELQPRRSTGMRILHRSRRYIPPDANSDGSINRLLNTADETTHAALARLNEKGGDCSAVAILSEAAAGRCQEFRQRNAVGERAQQREGVLLPPEGER